MNPPPRDECVAEAIGIRPVECAWPNENVHEGLNRGSCASLWKNLRRPPQNRSTGSGGAAAYLATRAPSFLRDLFAGPDMEIWLDS